jgi:cytochrome c oxidase subunit IV
VSEPSPSEEPAAPQAATASVYVSMGCGCVMAALGVFFILSSLVFTAAVATQDGQMHYGLLAVFLLMGVALIVVGFAMPLVQQKSVRERLPGPDAADR